MCWRRTRHFVPWKNEIQAAISFPPTSKWQNKLAVYTRNFSKASIAFADMTIIKHQDSLQMCSWLISLRINIYFFASICVSVCRLDFFFIIVISHSGPSSSSYLRWSLWYNVLRSLTFFLSSSTLRGLLSSKLLSDHGGSAVREHCALVSSWLFLFLFTFAFDREGVSWIKGREEDRLERQTPRVSAANLQMALVFIQLRTGRPPEHRRGRLQFFHGICEGKNTSKCVLDTWQMRRHRTAGMLLRHDWVTNSQYGRG